MSPLYQPSAAGAAAPFQRPGHAAGNGHKRHRRRRRRRSRFQWVVTGFSECTKTCGGGERTGGGVEWGMFEGDGDDRDTGTGSDKCANDNERRFLF